MTHTFATLAISPRAFQEIRNKLKAAGYDVTEPIDMHGIALTQGQPLTKQEFHDLCHDMPPKVPRCEFEKGCKQFQDEIYGAESNQQG